METEEAEVLCMIADEESLAPSGRRTGREPLPLSAFMHTNSFARLAVSDQSDVSEPETTAKQIAPPVGFEVYRKTQLSDQIATRRRKLRPKPCDEMMISMVAEVDTASQGGSCP